MVELEGLVMQLTPEVPILFNEVEIGRLLEGARNLTGLSPRSLPVPPCLIKMENTMVFKNPDAERFGITGVYLELQLDDGKKIKSKIYPHAGLKHLYKRSYIQVYFFGSFSTTNWW